MGVDLGEAVRVGLYGLCGLDLTAGVAVVVVLNLDVLADLGMLPGLLPAEQGVNGGGVARNRLCSRVELRLYLFKGGRGVNGGEALELAAS